MPAKGSRNAPIEISDDEDDQGNVAMYPEMTLVSAPEQSRAVVQKRKREESHENSHNRYFESKKARKRRRKLEREELARAQQAMLPPPFAVLPFIPTLNPWQANGFNPYPFGIPPHGVPFNQIPPLPPPPLYDLPQRYNNSGSSSTSSGPSAWVSSMADNQMPAMADDQDVDFWDTYSSSAPMEPRVELSPSPPPPQPYRAPPPPPPRAVTPPPVPVPAPAPPLATAAKPATLPKKPVSHTIGMNPDQDKHSKHGTFHPSPQVITSLPSKSQTQVYIPNPARTLVMEQLPKTHRTREFIKSWSKGAADAHPVYFAIDPPSGKALVEFATADLARRAWGSPKLGGPLAEGAKGKGSALKGKPRADLIRVWWYRVDGVGAGAGVGEIEEGEIEGDAGEREVSVPPAAPPSPLDATVAEPPVALKKETKKERKARLAREREVKTMATKTQMVTPPQLPEASSSVSSSSHPPLPTPFYSPPGLLPSLSPPRESPPPVYTTTAWAVDGSGPWGGSNGWGSPPPQPTMAMPTSFPPRLPPLPPQTALGAQWLPQPNWRPAPTPSPFVPQMDADLDMELETPQSAMGSTSMAYPLPPAPVSLIPPSVVSPPQLPLVAPPPTALPPPVNAGPGTNPPLEPRAMKNAPKGPRRQRQLKELEERIRRGRMEIASSSSAAGAEGQGQDDVPMPMLAVRENGEGEATYRQLMHDLGGRVDSGRMEEDLRRLVVRSQKGKSVKKEPEAAASSMDVAPASVALAEAVAGEQKIKVEEEGGEMEKEMETRTRVEIKEESAVTLDDLAVSFITETIQTLVPVEGALLPKMAKPAVGTAVSSISASVSKPLSAAAAKPKPLSSASSAKEALAARQRRLEVQIAESKAFMERLKGARTKEEKERVLGEMRAAERRRTMLEGVAAASEVGGGAGVGVATPVPQSAQIPSQKEGREKALSLKWEEASKVKFKWPESRNDVCVLIISDEEDVGSETEPEDGDF